MIFSALVVYHKFKLAILETISFNSAPDTQPCFMVEAVKVIMRSKYSLLQSDLKELGRDANTTFTNKTEHLQKPCKYMWNCPEMVLIPWASPFCPKTPSAPCQLVISGACASCVQDSQSYLLLPF